MDVRKSHFCWCVLVDSHRTTSQSWDSNCLVKCLLQYIGTLFSWDRSSNTKSGLQVSQFNTHQCTKRDMLIDAEREVQRLQSSGSGNVLTIKPFLLPTKISHFLAHRQVLANLATWLLQLASPLQHVRCSAGGSNFRHVDKSRTDLNTRRTKQARHTQKRKRK